MAVLLGVVVLFCAYQETFILRCIPKAITGYDCPFCGAQRALGHITHGEFKAAFLSNPYLFIISPYLITVLLCILGIIPQGSKTQNIIYSKPAIIRNTDFMKSFLSLC